MNTVFNIGLHHFLFVSIILVGAGVATMLTKRNAIGILIGVELVLNAAGINLVAFNKFSHPQRMVRHQLTAEQVAQWQELQAANPDTPGDELLLRVIRQVNPDAVEVSSQLWANVTLAAQEDGTATSPRHVLTVHEEARYAALRAEEPEASQEEVLLQVVRDSYPTATAASWASGDIAAGQFVKVRMRAVDGVAFAIFVIVLAAAETAVALAIFLNYYNNFSSIDVEKSAALKG